MWRKGPLCKCVMADTTPLRRKGKINRETRGQQTPGNVTLCSRFPLLEARATVLGSLPTAVPSQICHHLVSGLWLVRNLRSEKWVRNSALGLGASGSFAQQRGSRQQGQKRNSLPPLGKAGPRSQLLSCRKASHQGGCLPVLGRRGRMESWRGGFP